MIDILGQIATRSRPSLLITAARHAAGGYRREKQLPRLLSTQKSLRHGEAILKLLDIEAELNDRRVEGRADYAPARHIMLWAAILGEARLLRGVVAA